MTHIQYTTKHRGFDKKIMVYIYILFTLFIFFNNYQLD